MNCHWAEDLLKIYMTAVIEAIANPGVDNRFFQAQANIYKEAAIKVKLKFLPVEQSTKEAQTFRNSLL